MAFKNIAGRVIDHLCTETNANLTVRIEIEGTVLSSFEKNKA